MSVGVCRLSGSLNQAPDGPRSYTSYLFGAAALIQTGEKMIKQKNLSLKRNHWYFSKMVNGDRVWTKIAHKDDPVAVVMKAYHDIKNDHEQAKNKLQPLAALWLKSREREVEDGLLSEKTLSEYRKHLAPGARLDREFGKRVLDSIRAVEIQDYLDTGKRYQSNREIATLSQMIGWGVNRGYLEKNPTMGVKRNRELARNRYVTDEEFNTVYKAMPQCVKDLMMLTYLTGLRPGDALKVRFSDCYDEWLYAAEGKTGKKVRFYWSDELRELVESSRKRQPMGFTVVRDDQGNSFENYDRIQKLFKKHFPAGVERFVMKDIRAKSATDREDPVMASYALGHSSQAVTNKHYLRNQKGRLVSALSRKPESQ